MRARAFSWTDDPLLRSRTPSPICDELDALVMRHNVLTSALGSPGFRMGTPPPPMHALSTFGSLGPFPPHPPSPPPGTCATVCTPPMCGITPIASGPPTVLPPTRSAHGFASPPLRDEGALIDRAVEYQTDFVTVPVQRPIVIETYKRITEIPTDHFVDVTNFAHPECTPTPLFPQPSYSSPLRGCSPVPTYFPGGSYLPGPPVVVGPTTVANSTNYFDPYGSMNSFARSFSM